MRTGLICACLGTALAGTAHAGDANDLRNSWSGEYDTPGNLTITVSPMSLLEPAMPRLDLSAEIRTGESRSLAITHAMDMGRMLHDVAPKPDRELGLQLRDYIVGSFDNGLFLGGQLAFTNPDLLRFRADGSRFGPLAGVKVTLSMFTVEGRAGAWVDMGMKGQTPRIEPKVDFAAGFTF